jgi:hypothetical protein
MAVSAGVPACARADPRTVPLISAGEIAAIKGGTSSIPPGGAAPAAIRTVDANRHHRWHVTVM